MTSWSTVRENTAVAALAVGIATSSWNAVALGPLKVTHGALAVAGVLLVMEAWRGDHLVPPLPSWVWVLGAAIVTAATASTFWPPSVSHLVGRYAGHETQGITAATVSVETAAAANIVNALTWLVAAVAVPAIVGLAVVRRPSRITVLADACLLGATVNAVVALADHAGTGIGSAVSAAADFGDREAALTVQPNHAAVAIAIALPLALWRLSTPLRPAWRAVVAAAVLLLVGGLVTTGSRAGAVAAVAGSMMIALVEPRLRARLPAAAGMCAGALAAVLVVVPSSVSALVAATRLDGSGSADESDALRLTIAEQGLADAAHSPLFGIGLGVVDEAHNVVLQLLAAGGVVLLVGYAVAWCGFLVDGWCLREQVDGLPGALLVSGVTVLLVCIFTNTVTDVFVHIPFALMAGLYAAQRSRGSDDLVPARPFRREPAPVVEELHP